MATTRVGVSPHACSCLTNRSLASSSARQLSSLSRSSMLAYQMPRSSSRVGLNIMTRRLASSSTGGGSSGTPSSAPVAGTTAAIASLVVTALILSFSPTREWTIHNEAPATSRRGGASSSNQDKSIALGASQQERMRARSKELGVCAWGSNKYGVIAPDDPALPVVRTPRWISYFEGVALRDLILEEKHGVAVDAKGDVLQWGAGFFDPSVRVGRSALELGAHDLTEEGRETVPIVRTPQPPVRTLVGKDIVKVVASDTKVYALSRKGEVYVFSALQSLQSPGRSGWSRNPFRLFGLFSSREIAYERLHASAGLGSAVAATPFSRGESVADIVAGANHLLALSTRGRVFAAPIDAQGNTFGQLGTRRILLNTRTQGGKEDKALVEMEPRMLAQIDDTPPLGLAKGVNLPAWALPPGFEELAAAKATAAKQAAAGSKTLAASLVAQPASGSQLEPSHSIRFCTTLHEVASLRGLQISQLAAGTHHSVALTPSGRVLAWGRHTHGQCGVGSQLAALEAVPTPTEVVLARAFPASTKGLRCTAIMCGADNTYFVTERSEGFVPRPEDGQEGAGSVNLSEAALSLARSSKIDVLAAGKGQYGALGNAMWSQVTSTPVRVKSTSVMEFSEATGRSHPVPIHTLSIGRPGHVLLVLDTVEPAGHAAFGRDVLAWGHNSAFQLGTGRRNNLAVPQHLGPLPAQIWEGTKGGEKEEEGRKVERVEEGKLREADINSGALTHMPHKRLQLASSSRSSSRTPASYAPGAHRGGHKSVQVEEAICAGAGASAVFWRAEA